MKSHAQKIVSASLLASLVCVATMVIKIQSPIGGYMNLGDSVVLLSGWLLPPFYGFLAAGIRSLLADVFLGFIMYAPVTFVIKGLMAVCAHFAFKALSKKLKSLPSRVLSGISSEAIMILGYYLFEGIIYGFIPALTNMPANVIQGVAGLVVGVLLIKLFKKYNLGN